MISKLLSQQKSKIKFRLYSTKSDDNKKLYTNTVFLPKTKFPLRLEPKNLVQRDKDISALAEFDLLYQWQRSHLSEPEFVLHDGPPYANGKLHMGHALNKILKDTIVRSHILRGNKVHFVPGWDCHGLPIELKAKSKMDDGPLEIRAKARNFAKKTMSEQKEVFKSWGIIGDWNGHYATYSPEYMKVQMKIFNKLYQKNLIYRDVKPIYWSPSSRTALAEAELEYNERHISKSAYVRFKIKNMPNKRSDCTYALIWTTTPWSLPANQLVCYNPLLSYCLVKNFKDDNFYIVASDTIERLSNTLDSKLEVVENVTSSLLSQCTYFHPVYKDRILKFLPATHPTASKGTGLVHTAPAHGPEDFLVAKSHRLQIESLVDDLGCYNANAGEKLEGKFVLNEGTDTVLEIIKNDIILVKDFEHSYPYDWRTKKPVIIKASLQWFLDTDALKSRAIELLEDVKIIPKINSETYKRSLLNNIERRPYWCISRQRKWGVPIPIFFRKISREALISEDLVRHYCMLIDQHGTDFWWNLPSERIVPEEFRDGIDLDQLEKSQDILDIWFDSGISWASALEGTKIADLYLEGNDQFTGWFQSSLITSVALRDKAPFKTIYVHGFVVDERGAKMSKSVGNVVDPVEIVEGKGKKQPYGIDCLRWWVACHANQDSQAHISDRVLRVCAEELHKIRGVLRYALGCLDDYEDVNFDYKSLSLLDKYLLHLLYLFHQQAQDSLIEYQFSQISKNVINLLTNPVSALYYTSIKDRLYCDSLDSTSRKSSQFVLFQIFEIVSQAVAPIVPHLVEEMYQHLPHKNGKTYFMSAHAKAESCWENRSVDDAMNILLNIKRDINKEVGAGTLSSVVRIKFPEKVRKLIADVTTAGSVEEELEDIFQVSQVIVHGDGNIKKDFELEVFKTNSVSCARCRRFQSKRENELCERCNRVVSTFDDNATAAVGHS